MLRQSLDTFVPQGGATPITANGSSGKSYLRELSYRKLFETSQDGILILDAISGKIIDINPFLINSLNYLKEELIGKELWEIGSFKDIVNSKSSFIKLQSKGYIRYEDLPLQSKDGRTIDVEFIGSIYTVDDQKMFQCNIRDITERKKIERLAKSRYEEVERLHNAEERTRKALLNVMEDLRDAKVLIEIEKAKDEAMLTSIGEGLVVADTHGKIIIVNRVAEEMLGLSQEDLMGKDIIEVLPLKDEEGRTIPSKERPINLPGQNITRTFFFVRKDKTKISVAVSRARIKLGKKIIGVVDVFRDNTREKEIDKAKTEFVSLASHQLRTPLGIIKWYLEALIGDKRFIKSSVMVRKYISEVYKSNERVLNLVRDLLSVSRIEQGRVKDLPTSVNPIKIVKEIVEQMQIPAGKKKIALNAIIKTNNIPSINVDSLRFHEVLENLISNALEYTLTAGKVNVVIDKVGNTFSISVKDTGIGISEKDQKKLFTKFFRSEKAVENNPEGSGLGLYVVKSYVEGWGGKVFAKSSEGKGSTFTISLPITQK